MQSKNTKNDHVVLAIYKIVFLIIIGLCAGGVVSSVEAAPVSVDVPVHHWTYSTVERLAARGFIDMRGLSTRPLSRIQMAGMVKQAIENIREEDLKEESEQLKFLNSLEEDLDKLVDEFRTELVMLGEDTLSIKGGVPKSEFRFVTPLKIQRVHASLESQDTTLLRNRRGWVLEDGGNTRMSIRTWGRIENIVAFSAEPAYYHSRSRDDTTFDEGYARVQISNLELTIGRNSFWWGASSQGSLLLSDNAAPLDAITLKNSNSFFLPGPLRRIGQIDAMIFATKLKRARFIPKAKMSGLRVTIAPSPDVVIGFSKIVMMGGQRGGDSLGLDDIIKAFFVAHENEQSEANNNQLSMVDFIWRLRNTHKYLPFTNNIVLNGQIGADGEEDGGISNLGYLGGVHLPDIFQVSGLSLKAEYASTKKHSESDVWYSHNLYQTGFTHKENNLGHFMGGDAQNIYVRLEKEGVFKDNIAAGLFFDHTRSGINDVNPETRRRVGIDMTFFKNAFLECGINYFIEKINNFRHVDDSEATNHVVELTGRAVF